MPIKKDTTGRRWVEMDFIAPGTPEQVWHAVATGPGNTSWFTKTDIDEYAGGTIRFDFGPNGGSTGEVTAWEPPRRFAYVERDWDVGAPPVVTEILIEKRASEQCVVRMTHTITDTTDTWDASLESFEKGWPAFFTVLRLYLIHFAGHPAAPSQAMSSTAGDQLSVWKLLTDLLGLAGANVGETRTTAAVPEQWTGVIEQITQDEKQRFLVMRISAPAPGVAIVGTYDAGKQVRASVTVYWYGNTATTIAAASEPQWQAWLGATFQDNR